MRIGQFLAHYPASGGSTTVLRGLASGLAELGHEVVAYGYGVRGSWQMTAPGLESFVLAPPRLRGRFLTLVPVPDRLANRIATNSDKLDILIVHGMWSPYSTRLGRAARSAGVPCIAQPHDPYSPAVFGAQLRKTAYWRFVERPFLSSVEAVQVYAPSHRTLLKRLGVHVPSFVVPAGIDRQTLDRADTFRGRPHLSEPCVRVLYLGRFDVFNKGIDLLLDALAADSTLRSNLRLDLVGGRSDVEMASVERLVAERGLGSVATVYPRRNDPWTLLSAADLLVLPSRFDGFAQVVTEALAVGTPTIVSKEAGAAEFLTEKQGVLQARPDQHSLRAALLDACKRLPELRAAAANAHHFLRSELTWTSCASHWLAAVSELELADARPTASATGNGNVVAQG